MISVLFFACSCAQNQGRLPVSLIQLIAYPDKYVGREIMVHGYLDELDEPNIFLSVEDAMMRNVLSATRIHMRGISLSETECIRNYVMVIGHFKQLEYISFPVITDVTEIVKYDLNAEPGNELKICWSASSQVKNEK